MKLTNLFIIALLLNTSTFAASPATSAILLGTGNVTPAGILSIPLSPLLKDVHYNLICHINNPQAETVDMRFEPSATHITYGKVVLNEAVLDNLQGSLQSGENTLTVNEISIAENEHSTLQFKNLDFKNTAQISNCVAKPAIHAVLATYNNGGSFIIYNNTFRAVEIGVGNFFPTPYTIYPHSARWVFVSTDNQNISINNIY